MHGMSAMEALQDNSCVLLLLLAVSAVAATLGTVLQVSTTVTVQKHFCAPSSIVHPDRQCDTTCTAAQQAQGAGISSKGEQHPDRTETKERKQERHARQGSYHTK